MDDMITFEIDTEFIQLDKLLKACRIAHSGGEAHGMVEQGFVTVNGVTENRKRAKIKPGDTVRIGNKTINVKPKR